MGPKEVRSSVQSPEEEAIIVALRRRRPLPLDDCRYGLQPTFPHLTRTSSHRCRTRHGISRLPELDGEAAWQEALRQLPDRLLPHRAGR